MTCDFCGFKTRKLALVQGQLRPLRLCQICQQTQVYRKVDTAAAVRVMIRLANELIRELRLARKATYAKRTKR